MNLCNCAVSAFRKDEIQRIRRGSKSNAPLLDIFSAKIASNKQHCPSNSPAIYIFGSSDRVPSHKAQRLCRPAQWTREYNCRFESSSALGLEISSK